MKDFMDSLVWISLFSVVMWIVLFIFVIPVIKKMIGANREAKREESKLQRETLTSELFKKSPELYIKFEELQGSYKLIALGLKWGWLPFLLIFVVLLGPIGDLTAHGRAPLFAIMIVALIMLPLVIFYAFLFKRAINLKAKISATKLEIAAESKVAGQNGSSTENKE